MHNCVLISEVKLFMMFLELRREGREKGDI